MGESTVNERTEELKHIYRQGSRNKEAVANQELDTMYEIAREARGKEACLCCQRLVEEVQELVSSGRSFMYCARWYAAPSLSLSLGADFRSNLFAKIASRLAAKHPIAQQTVSDNITRL